MNRRLNRRQALAGFGTMSLGAVLAACGGGSDDADPAASPEADSEFDEARDPRADRGATEGPYDFDADAIRCDIREDRPGRAPAGPGSARPASCEPIEDVGGRHLHRDAGGVYSGFEAARTPLPARTQPPTPTAWPNRRRSNRAGTRAGPSTSTPRSTPTGDRAHTQRVLRRGRHGQGVRAQPQSTTGAGPLNGPEVVDDASLVVTVRAHGDGYRGLPRPSRSGGGLSASASTSPGAIHEPPTQTTFGCAR